MAADVYVRKKQEIDNKIFLCVKKNICSAKSIPSTLVCIECCEPLHLGCSKRFEDIVYIKGNLVQCCNFENNSDSYQVKYIEISRKYDEL